MTNILGSFTKWDNKKFFDNDRFLTYVTNLLELVLSTSSSDFYSESLLFVLNKILSLSSKLVNTLTSVHVSLAVKSSLENSNETLIYLIKGSDKLAKAFRKLILKDTNAIKNVEKLLIATLESIDKRKDVKSKFVKEIAKVFQTEVVKFLKDDVCNLPRRAIISLRRLLKILKNEHNIEFEDLNLNDYNAGSVSQILLVDTVYGSSDKDDETKSLILMPSLKVAVAELKKNTEDDVEFELLFAVINQRREQLHSLSSFYTNSEHNAVWTQFVKSVLKNCLKMVLPCNNDRSLKKGALALHTLTELCEKLYGISNAKKKKTRGWKEKADEDCQQIFNMICGHSNFLGLLYSKNNFFEWQKLKSELLYLIIVLIESNPKICEDLELPVFLGAYHATLSAPDCAILHIVQRCEVQTSGEGKVSKLAMLQPLLWGQAAVSKYSTLHNKMTKVTRTSEVLQLIEPERMLRSALKFPLHASLNTYHKDSTIEYDSNHYDPRFFLPLICHLCSPGAYIDRHLKLIESGVLALVFASFSCYDARIRALGCTALWRIHVQIASAKKALSAEKQIWLHIIEVVKNGLAQQIDESDGVPKRVPSITTAFLTRATTILSSPLDPMYKSISSFILAKPSLDMFSVPNFLRLFHSQNIRQIDEEDEKGNESGNKLICFTNTQHITERNWILAVIRDGLRDMLDFSILQQNFVFKILLTFFSSRNSNLRSGSSKPLILSILKLAVGIKDKALDLIKRHGLFLWIVEQTTLLAEEITSKNNVEENEKLFEDFLDIICFSWSAIQNIFRNKTVAMDDFLTLVEIQNTVKDTLRLTLNIYKTRAFSLKAFRSVMLIIAEIEVLRKTRESNSEDLANQMIVFSSTEMVKELCWQQLCWTEMVKDQDNDYRMSSKDVQRAIEELLNSQDI